MDRQVGNRHGIFMKNAMVHYTMFAPYLEWCSYMRHDVKDANALHNRVLTKLQTMELKGIIRGRGIFYAKVHHVLLCAFKSKRRAATQLDVCTFLVELQLFCIRLQRDATFLLDTDEKLLDGDAVLQGVYNQWARARTRGVLIANLMRPDPETRDMTLTCLQAYATAILDQLQKNSTEYLEVHTCISNTLRHNTHMLGNNQSLSRTGGRHAYITDNTCC